MFAVAPASVLLMGVLGLLVLAVSLARMTVLERRLHRAVVAPASVAPAQPVTRAAA
jgi:hypothetical protein